MRSSRLVPLALALSACADVFGFQDLHETDAQGVPDSAVESSVDAPADVAIDTPLVCEGGVIKDCGGQCVDVSQSASNCGSCGHDCGGGTCSQGACLLNLMRDSLTNPIFDIDSTSFYFSSGSRVLQCPLGGCKVSPTQLEDSQTTVYGTDTASGVLFVDQGNFFFVADPVQNTVRPTLYTCPLAGCPTSPTALRNTGLQGGFPGGFAKGPSSVYWAFYKQIEYTTCSGSCSATAQLVSNISPALFQPVPIAADANGLYFILPSGALQHCPATGACTAPDTLLSAPNGITQIVAYNSNLYLLHPGTEGGIPNGFIQVCPTTGTCTPVSFIDKQPNPTHIAVDSSGVTWFAFDAPLGNTFPAATIYTCPLKGCVGGPRPLATAQTGTTMLLTDAAFVYWATASQILRVAK